MSGKLIYNIIHRADSGKEFEGFRFQQEEVHARGLKSTILVPYPAMYDKEVMDYVKAQAEQYGDEIGIHFHLLRCEQFDKLFETTENALYLHTFEKRIQILTHIFDMFKEIFGFIPSSIGGYYFDAKTLSWIKKNYPQVKTAIISCFEEGVHMFAGTDHSWMLFSDGGSWGSYIPSIENSFCPAKDGKDAIDIVALPHLNRDMLLAVTGRDDYFSSHPANVMRGKANEGAHSTYLERFLDQWVKQVQYNGYEYYSLFVSPPWVMEGKIFEESYLDSRMLYRQALKDLQEREEKGLAVCMTMSEYGDWYRNHLKTGRCEINHWKDILCGSKRELIWFVEPDYRMTIDPNMGGAITDLRPYAGRLDRSLGPDTKCLWNGSYPFVVSYEHRAGSAGGSIHTCEISCNGHSALMSERRTTAEICSKDENQAEVYIHPVEYKLGEIVVTVSSCFKFVRGKGVTIKRNIEKISDPSAKVTLKELHRGTWGTTQYPEDMRGIILSISGSGGEENLEYRYEGKKLKSKTAGCLRVQLPMLQAEVSIESLETSLEGSVEEGILFQPYYTLSMEKTAGEGEVLETCLKIKRI